MIRFLPSRPNRFLGLACVLVVGLGLFSGSVSVPQAGSGGDDGAVAPRIQARPIPIVPGPKPNRSLLPRGARGFLPGYIGDGLYVTLPRRVSAGQTASQVYASSIVPVLRSIGFTKSAGRIGVPRGSGIRLRRPNLALVAGVACREFTGMREALEICDVMQGQKPATPEINRIFLTGEGMTFAQFKAEIERQRIQYVFTQLVGTVPIEHSGLTANRWDGEVVTEVKGTVFVRHAIANKPTLTITAAVALAQKRLAKLKGVRAVEQRRGLEGDLVLLPWGGKSTSAGPVPALRYAYRVLLFARIAGPAGLSRGSWLAWVDAQTGALLKLIPQFNFVTGSARQWRRAPDVGVQTASAAVDPSSGGQYTLQLSGFMNRIDRFGNGNFGVADQEVSILDGANGSSATFANFDQAPINQAANAVCQSGGNNTFRQANVYSHLYLMRQTLVWSGMPPSFPEQPITTYIDMPGDSNGAGYDTIGGAGSGQSLLTFASAAGFAAADCPNAVNTKMNGATDATTLIHELAHLSTKRLQERRPATWCGMAVCQIPVGYSTVHDLADAMAHHYASINCMGGWSRHSETALNASLNCIDNTSEAGWLPRRARVTVPFTPADPGDHFPEHRLLGTGDYADNQIIAAALWEVRKAMRSKCLPSGTPQFFVRLVRAIWDAGFQTPATTCANCDRDLYRLLQDLEKQMTFQWAQAGQPGGPPGFAHNGNHTTNKVTAGFARTGLFLVPWQCIDGDAGTTDSSWCPSGENGGDAVIDIDDNSAANDLTIDSVVHPTFDYLLRTGGPPTFHVWTGPRYMFNASGTATGFTPSAATPSPCYVQYQVEVSDTADFSGTVVTSTPGAAAWQTVSQTTSPECYGTWTMGMGQWNMLKGASGEVRLYYRVRTRNAAGDAATERTSTSPGNGFQAVPSAYAIVNDSGTP